MGADDASRRPPQATKGPTLVGPGERSGQDGPAPNLAATHPA